MMGWRGRKYNGCGELASKKHQECFYMGLKYIFSLLCHEQRRTVYICMYMCMYVEGMHKPKY
jgi:hypothetical protein